MANFPLGRRAPESWDHYDKYPLTAATAPDVPVPVVIGVNWYSAFDQPERDSAGHYWIGRSGNLGRLRGEHCTCLKSKGVTDLESWWDFYDQGAEGACVGFGASRMMTLLNRKRYFARWLWDRAKAQDEWPETNPGDGNGTSVAAALDVLRVRGHIPWSSKLADADADWHLRTNLQPALSEGISANRWASSAAETLDVVGYTGLGYVDVINSWGRAYPHLVRMPDTVLERLIAENGEVGLVTDR